jgi:hypothetical protein
MKFCSSSKMMALALTVLLAASALAGNDAHKGSMQLSESAQVNGSQLVPGEYQVQSEGTGPNVELSITKGKKVLAKAQARVLALSDKTSNDAVVFIKNTDGSKSVTEIQFAGKKFALALGNESAETKSRESSK